MQEESERASVTSIKLSGQNPEHRGSRQQAFSNSRVRVGKAAVS